MRSSRLRRRRFEPDGVHTDLEAERKRRQWAEQLAETSLDVGEEHVSRAVRAEQLLNELIGRIESHKEAAEQADALRTGDLRLYRHVSRVRAELETLDGPSPVSEVEADFAERVSEDTVDAPDRASNGVPIS